MKLWVQKTLFLMTPLFPDLILVPQEREHPALKIAWFCQHSFFQGHVKISCSYQPVLFQNNFEIHNVYGRWPSTSLQKRGYKGIKVFLLRVTKHSRIEQEINQAPEIKPRMFIPFAFPSLIYLWLMPVSFSKTSLHFVLLFWAWRVQNWYLQSNHHPKW